MNINNLFGQQTPPQQPQMPQYPQQNQTPQYWQPQQSQQPQFRPPMSPQTVKPKAAKPKKRGVKLKAKKIFKVTRLEIYTVGVIVLCLVWKFFATTPAQIKTAPKKAAKTAISYKGKVQK